jgi:hypothetical protein
MGILKLKAGDDLSMKFTIVDSDGDAINLTGGTIAFKIASVSVSNDNAEFFGEFTSFTDPTNGISVNTIPDSTSKDWTPGSYQYQTRFIDSSGVVQSEVIDQCEILENLIDDE